MLYTFIFLSEFHLLLFLCYYFIILYSTRAFTSPLPILLIIPFAGAHLQVFIIDGNILSLVFF